MSDNKISILITGATGYIGGTVLGHLLKSSIRPQIEITALIRDSNQSETIQKIGVKPIQFSGLDDLEVIKEASSQVDFVINTASASHHTSAIAIIEGQSLRKKSGKRSFGILHTSGTSILSDRNGGNYSSEEIHSDLEDIYSFEKNHEESYSQRITDLAVFENGEKYGVDVRIICPPTIYGKGTGPVATLSQQVPNIVRGSLKEGQTIVIGKGAGIWDHCHVSDVASLFELITRKVINGETVPKGKEGFFFCENGDHTWLQVSEGVAKELKSLGKLPTEEIKSVTVQRLADHLGGNVSVVELGLASNSRSRAEKSRKLGWNPSVPASAFFSHFEDEVKRTLEKK
eukprot:TRINITY_DN8408_c0_g1_i1.p1 TRINITY_DN8408_c0_g1~~TRINITY_DN8408_c0_g1_i1.p1  ORF type:complete len:344 (-),score=131.33 TRINITY_DN8408_c0_g1_i1:163-1194(-)